MAERKVLAAPAGTVVDFNVLLRGKRPPRPRQPQTCPHLGERQQVDGKPVSVACGCGGGDRPVFDCALLGVACLPTFPRSEARLRAWRNNRPHQAKQFTVCWQCPSNPANGQAANRPAAQAPSSAVDKPATGGEQKPARDGLS